ncbi:MAG: hypothetical protein ACRDVE_21865 [Actinocrinis sp.]
MSESVIQETAAGETGAVAIEADASGPAEPASTVGHGPLVAVTQVPIPIPIAASVPVPIPVLGPYLGLVAAVLCVLGGSWLLLAPYALDLRHGAVRLPRAAQLDLETGAAIMAVGVVTAASFAFALVRRLRAEAGVDESAEAFQGEDGPQPAADSGAAASAEVVTGGAAESDVDVEPESEVEAEPEPPVEAQSAELPRADPGGSLREMLTPLVAALAADLRSQNERSRSERDRADQAQGPNSQASNNQGSHSQGSNNQGSDAARPGQEA